jgi:hypothetical protein
MVQKLEFTSYHRLVNATKFVHTPKKMEREVPWKFVPIQLILT